MSGSKPDLDLKPDNGHPARSGIIPEELLKLRAYISAPYSVDTSVLRRALEDRRITPYELDELDPDGRSMTELLEDSLKQTDLVVAILAGGDSNNHILFELGFATAMKKRILAIVPPEGMEPINKIPFLLTGTQFLHARHDHEATVNRWLDYILKAPQGHASMTREPIRRTKPLGILADELLDRVRGVMVGPEGTSRELAFEEIIRTAIEASGIDNLYYSPKVVSESARADMAIWSDDFEPWLSNPVAVEVKGPLQRQAELAEAALQLTDVLGRTRDGWGLLIYQGEVLEPEAPWHSAPRVLFAPIEKFLELLRDRSLGDVLRRMRYSRVHGKG